MPCRFSLKRTCRQLCAPDKIIHKQQAAIHRAIFFLFISKFYVVVIGGAHQHNIFPFTEVAPWLYGSVYKSRTPWTVLDWKIHFVFSLLWRYSWSHRPFCPLASNLAVEKCRCCISGSKCHIWMEAGRMEPSGSTQSHSIGECFCSTVIWFQCFILSLFVLSATMMTSFWDSNKSTLHLTGLVKTSTFPLIIIKGCVSAMAERN